ncbi:MAG: hypothetical protein IIB95_01430 [Candidatus Marinimicrobia bacterium]|nr:hypothetical protein [Candidatus Neomarinimicrobiota bacterium]
MINKKNLIVFLSIIGLVIMSCDDNKDDHDDHITDLHVKAVSSAPTLDGNGNDAVWSEADALELTLGQTAEYANGFGEVDLTLKAVRYSSNLYILAEWMDPTTTENVDKNLLTYVDGAWSKSGNEDRMFFMFDMGENGSEGANCATMCHGGMMYTETGQVDIWHWKAARTNPLSLADDKYFDNIIGDDGGRHGDAKTISAYKNNYTKDGAGVITPLYSGPITDGHYIIIPEGGTTADLTPYTDADINLTIPGYYLNANATNSGESRHDVSAIGKYSGGKWTVEFKRKLDTGNAHDVEFGQKNISVTVAVTDNSGGNHSGSAPFNIEF